VIATANPNGHVVPSPVYGNGLIDAAAAVTAYVKPSTSPTPSALLQDWIHLHRRIDTVPTAAPTAAPVVRAIPSSDPPLPSDTAASPWLPTELTLTYISVPLLVLLGFAILVTLFGIGALRRLKRNRSNR